MIFVGENPYRKGFQRILYTLKKIKKRKISTTKVISYMP
jgi:hypothetical protein